MFNRVKELKISIISSILLSFGLGLVWIFNFPLKTIQSYPIINVFQSPGYFILHKFIGEYQYRSPEMSYLFLVIFISFLLYLLIFIGMTLIINKIKQSKSYSSRTMFMILSWFLFLLSLLYLYSCQIDDITGIVCYLGIELDLILAVYSTLGILLEKLISPISK